MQRPLIRKETLEAQVYQTLKKAILAREFAGGERLIQDEIAETFGTSRIPARDALKKLEVDGLVTTDERGAYFVSIFGQQDLQEIYAIRALLEPYAAVQAMSKLSANDLETLEKLVQAMEQALKAKNLEEYSHLNQAFHFTLYEASQERHLLRMIKTLWSGFPPFTPIAVPTQSQRSLEEHLLLLEGLKAGDVKAVEEGLRAHIQHACTSLLAHLAQTERG